MRPPPVPKRCLDLSLLLAVATLVALPFGLVSWPFAVAVCASAYWCWRAWELGR